MRVSYFYYVYNSAGPLVQIHEFAKAFRSLGHEITLHAEDPKPKSSATEKLRAVLKRYTAPYLHELNTLRKNGSYYRRASRVVSAEKPDLILARYKLYHLAPAFVARRFNLPFVVWIDAPGAYEQRHYLRKFFQIPGLAEYLERTIVSMADRAMVVSEEIKKYLSHRPLLDGRIEVVPNGVDTEKFHPALDGRDIRRRFPFEDAVIFGFVGSFSPWHGMERLKFLLESGLKLHSRACFLLVGDGPRRPELEAFIAAKGWDKSRIQFSGHIPHAEVPRYIAAMDVCLLPYDQEMEGFYFSPLKLFEYLACGKPVLASGIGQIRQVIQEGVNGLLDSAHTSEDTLRQLKKLIENPDLRRRLGENARQTVLSQYTWYQTARKIEQIFESVLRDHSKNR